MVLVTGGTGLVGSHLLFKLTEDNVGVRAIYRTPERLLAVEKIFTYYSKKSKELFNRIEWVKADILDIPSLERAFENITEVYHCAALISFDPGDFKLLEKINREGTANIVNLGLFFNIKKLCYVSTIGAIGRSIGNNLATEENDWNSQHTNVYALSKFMAEMEVWRGAQEGLAAVIVNPGVIIGPGFWHSGSGTLFTTALKKHSFCPPGGTGFIGVNDVVNIMIRLTNLNIQGERYILVAQNLTYKKVLEKISLNIGKPKKYKVLKIWHLKVISWIDWLLSFTIGKKRRLNSETLFSLQNPETYDNQKISKELAYNFEQIDDVLEQTTKQFISEVFL